MNMLSQPSNSTFAVVTGDYGVGKSTSLARLVQRLLPKDGSECAVKSPDGKHAYKVFYHFSTLSFGSEVVDTMLERLLHDIYKVKEVSGNNSFTFSSSSFSCLIS